MQQELDRTTERVTAMLNSMEGVEKQIDSRGDISDSIIMHLENNLQTSDRTISALQVKAFLCNATFFSFLIVILRSGQSMSKATAALVISLKID